MKGKKQSIECFVFDLFQFHSTALLPIHNIHPDKDEDVEDEGGEGSGDAAKDPDGESREAPGVGGGAGQGGIEQVDEDEEGGDEEDAAGGVGHRGDQEAHRGDHHDQPCALRQDQGLSYLLVYSIGRSTCQIS